MRALLCFGWLAFAAVAHAEPSLHVSVQPTFALFFQTRNDTFHSAPMVDSTATMSGSGVGTRVDVGVAGRIATSVKLGAVLRVGYHDFESKYDTAYGVTYRETQMNPTQFGPQITIQRGRLFLRSDLTLGRLDREVSPYSMEAKGVLGLVGVGTELGYDLPLSTTWSAQFGLGASATHLYSHYEALDYELTERALVFGLAAMVSMEARSF